LPLFCCPLHETMGFNPKNKDDIIRLSTAVKYSFGKALKPFRDHRLEAIREYVGRHYSDNGTSDRVPINLLELAVNIYLQRLASKAPNVDVSTKFKQLKDKADRFGIALNYLITEEIEFADALEMVVLDAVFSVGIMKVGINNTTVEVGGILHDVAQAFADHISLDDWVHDMTVKRFEQAQFMGNRYQMPLWQAKELFPDKADKLISVERRRGQETDRDLSEGESSTIERFNEVVDLWDLWLPQENVVLTCQVDDATGGIAEVLNVVEWTGPEKGPYHFLSFSKVPNNTMPLAPAALWMDLHKLANELFRKLGRQAGRQKTVIGVRGGADADGNRILSANDGDMVRLDDPKAAQEYKFGGIDQESLGFLIMVKDLFAYLGGNLDALGGLGPQAETLGQDQLLTASASQRMQKMQNRTVGFTKRVIGDLGWYQWTDPTTEYAVTKRVPGLDVAVEDVFGPMDREQASEFMRFNIKIQPYSMQNQTPEMKLMAIKEIFMNFLAPFAPQMAEQGITINFEGLLKLISDLGNLPELNELLDYANPQQQQQPTQPPKQSPVTTRKYERINRPGATRQGKDQIMQQALFGGKPQNSEMSSLMRPTG